MASKVSQRAVYLATAAIVVAMIGGFAVAQLSLGVVNNSYQGSQTTNVTPLPGLTWVSTDLTAVATGTTFTTGCGVSAATACDVTTAPALLCAGTYTGSNCAPGDFIEQVNLTTVLNTPFYGSTYPVTVSLTLFVTGTPAGGSAGTYAGTVLYFTETGANTAVVISLDFDTGVFPHGPGAVTSISVLATT
jgi:hypothetical protein